MTSQPMRKFDQAVRAACHRSHEYEKAITQLEARLSEELNRSRQFINDCFDVNRHLVSHSKLVGEAQIFLPEIANSTRDIGDGYQAVGNTARDVKDATKMLQDRYSVTRKHIEQLTKELRWLDTHWRERHWRILKGDAPVSQTATVYFRLAAFVLVVVLPSVLTLAHFFRPKLSWYSNE